MCYFFLLPRNRGIFHDVSNFLYIIEFRKFRFTDFEVRLRQHIYLKIRDQMFHALSFDLLDTEF